MASSEKAAAEPPLAAAELPDVEALVREAGWNQTAADWRAFIELGRVDAIRAEGRVVATTASLPYGNRFAWISMVLVAAPFRRRGLATRLLRLCIDDLAAGDVVPVLDATPDGRAVYRGLGFMDTWTFRRMERRAGAAPHAPPAAEDAIDLRAAGDDIWPALCAYDAAAFGADRSGLLTRLRGRASGAALYAERNGRIAGFALGRDGRLARQIGPIVADDGATARALLARALAASDGPVFIDVPDAKADAQAYLAACGFVVQRPFTRMVYRRAAAFDDGERTYAVAGPEFG